MEAGVIALLSSDKAGLDNKISKTKLPDSSPFNTLTTTLRVNDELTLKGGVSAYVGRVGQEDVEKSETTSITEEGEIVSDKKPEKITRTTRFLLIPDEFVAVETSSGEFLFPFLNEETSHSAFPAEFSLDSFAEDHPDAEYWKAGFTDRGDGAENGVLHGDTVFEDSEFGNVIVNSVKNQLGIKIEYDGKLSKLYLTKSGYVNYYGADETNRFAELILDELMRYTQMK